MNQKINRAHKNRKTNRLEKLLFLLVDIVLICLSYYAVMRLWLPVEVLAARHAFFLLMMSLVVAIVILFYITNGLYSTVNKRFPQVIVELAVSHFSASILILGINYIFATSPGAWRIPLAGAALNFVLVCLWRRVSWTYERRLRQAQDVMIVGNKEECEHIYRRIQDNPLLDMNIKYVCTDLSKVDWQQFVNRVEEVILCAELPLKNKSEISRYAIQQGVQIVVLPKSYGMLFQNMELDQIDDIPVYRPKEMMLTLDQRVLKRCSDVVLGGLAFLIFLPVMVCIAIAIKVKDPGPILYSQMRVGRYEEEFRIYKFRTMIVNAEKLTGPVIAGEDDPRITPLGRFLRKTRLDELPQLWNVIKGDMSIVGPRPERKFFCDQFAKVLPLYMERHNVKPGITGLAQVRGKYNTTAHDKLVYDLRYIQNYSFMWDMAIMVQTVKIMCTKSATEGIDYDADAINLEALEAANIQEKQKML